MGLRTEDLVPSDGTDASSPPKKNKNMENHINHTPKIRNDFIFEIFSGSYILSIVLLFWNNTILLSLLLMAGLLANLWYWKDKTDAAVMIVAALLGTSAEMFCVHKGVWTYKAPHLMMGVPLWLPLVWAYLFCFFRRVTLTVTAFLDAFFPFEKSYVQKTMMVFLAVPVISYSAFTLMNISRYISAVYTVFLVISLCFWRTRKDLVIFVFGAVCGTLGEYLCMKLGYWKYHYPFFRSVGLPLSLPLAWGLSSVVISRLAGKVTGSSSFKRKPS